MQDISNTINEDQLKLEEGKWLTIAEAAKYLRISKDTLRRWEKEKILKPYRSPSNHRYYQKRELDLVFVQKPEFKEENELKVVTPKIEIAKPIEKQRTIKENKTNPKLIIAGLAYLIVFGFLLWVLLVI